MSEEEKELNLEWVGTKEIKLPNKIFKELFQRKGGDLKYEKRNKKTVEKNKDRYT